MKSSPSQNKNDFLIAPPSRIKSGGAMSKLGTWFSYKYTVHSRLINTILLTCLSSVIVYNGVYWAVDSYKESNIQKIAAQKVMAEKVNVERLATLKKVFDTQKILTPMEEKDFTNILNYAKSSYEDSIRDLSKAYFSMVYVAEEGVYEIVFDSMQKEFTDLVNEMNVEYSTFVTFMNGFKNNVRIYQSALENGNIEIVNTLEKQMNKDMKIYAKWYNLNVSGQYHKTDRVKERATRHVDVVQSLDGLNKFLASKTKDINNMEPFSSIVIK